MEDLKPYMIPGIALVVLGLWFFVIQPRLTSEPDSAAAAAGANSASGGQAQVAPSGN